MDLTEYIQDFFHQTCDAVSQRYKRQNDNAVRQVRVKGPGHAVSYLNFWAPPMPALTFINSMSTSIRQNSLQKKTTNSHGRNVF